jgi:hypothetical protein
LLEIDPANQKTRADFIVTEQMLGVRAVDIRSVVVNGRRVSYRCDGTLVPVHRIYNRTITDELERRGIAIPFHWTDDLDVEWAGHPNWYFRLSKFSLPYLRHPAVPHTQFVDTAVVGDPSDYVLKPLYSFAGSGVVVGPSREQLDAIPVARRHDYIVQERVEFKPVIATPAGMTKVEVRIMYIRSGGEYRTVNTIIRMGRGAQMGVDHNKAMEWVGASAGFIDNAL